MDENTISQQIKKTELDKFAYKLRNICFGFLSMIIGYIVGTSYGAKPGWITFFALAVILSTWSAHLYYKK